MELFIFWAIVNAIVGAAIGARKNMVGGAIALALLLGPIGWIIALVVEGNLRKCPFCAENVKDAAIVCPHCHRDLPKPEAPRPFIEPKPAVAVSPQERKRRARNTGVVLAVMAVLVIATIIIAFVTRKDSASLEIDRRTAELNQLYTESPTPAPTPEFVRLTSDYTFYDPKTGREIKTADPGTKLRVVSRYEHDVVVAFRESTYSIPTAITEPAR